MYRDTRDDDAHREAALSTAYTVVKRKRKEVRSSRWRWRWRSCRWFGHLRRAAFATTARTISFQLVLLGARAIICVSATNTSLSQTPVSPRVRRG